MDIGIFIIGKTRTPKIAKIMLITAAMSIFVFCGGASSMSKMALPFSMRKGQPQLGHFLLISEIILPHSGHVNCLLKGEPHFGQWYALSETLFPHSGHVISAITIMIWI